VREAQADRERFSELYQRIAPSVHAWAVFKLKPPLRGTLEPEDVVQEVWWRALEGLARYDPERASFRTWIFGIANHVLLHAWRSVKTRGARTPDAETADPALSQVPDDATAISRVVARMEHLRLFLGHAQTLLPEEQTLLLHCGLEGLSSTEAAPLLGVSAPAVAKRWQRLRARLREAIPLHDLLA
jgi:RNA polymerase sigma factor (sigma-70 family)